MMKTLIAGFAALLLLAVCPAQAVVITDGFDNGVVEDSDSISGFWNAYTDSTASITESGSTLSLVSSDSASRRATLISDSDAAADFWSSAVSLKISDFAYYHSPGVTDTDTIFHFGFTSHGTTTTMRNMKDVFGVSLRRDGRLDVGWNTATGVNPEDGNELLNVADVGAGSSIDSIELQLDGTGSQLAWTLILGRGGEFQTYTDVLSIADTAALKAEWDAAGRYRVALEGQSGGSVNSTGEYVQFDIGGVTLETIPEPATLSLFVISSATLFALRKVKM